MVRCRSMLRSRIIVAIVVRSPVGLIDLEKGVPNLCSVRGWWRHGGVGGLPGGSVADCV